MATSQGLHCCFWCLSIAALLTVAGCHKRSAPAQPHWYKGNLHAHTLRSDGEAPPDQLIQWYIDHGYQFLGLSEHNQLASAEQSLMLAPGRQVLLPSFKQLSLRYSRPAHFLLMQNEEVTNDTPAFRVHLTGVHLAEVVPPSSGTERALVIEDTLHLIDEQARSAKIRSLGIINHPNFTWALGAGDIATLKIAKFLEVFNGHPYSASRGDNGRRSVFRIWDMINAQRVIEQHWPPLLGVAGDDTHALEGADEASPGRGWIVVRSTSLRADALVSAMLQGDFYASTGVALRDYTYDQARRLISISIAPELGVQYQTAFISIKRDAKALPTAPADDRWDTPGVGLVVRLVEGTQVQYQLADDDVLVRAEITASVPVDNPIQQNYTGDAYQPKQAFTQPVGAASR